MLRVVGAFVVEFADHVTASLAKATKANGRVVLPSPGAGPREERAMSTQ